MDNETYQLQPLPASIQTQVDMLNAKIGEARKVLYQAQTDRGIVLDTFYGLKGKLIEYAEQRGFRAGRVGRTITYRLRVEHVFFNMDGTLHHINGTVIPKGKQPADVLIGMTKLVYASAFAEGRVKVLGDA
jgi:hypothetical protein